MQSGRKSASVDKAFELVHAVSDAGRDGITLGALASRAGIAVSTAHRYVTSLLELGVLDRDPAGSYRLGVTLIMLAGQYLDEDGLRAAARPYLSELVELSGETVHLGVLVGEQIVYVDKVESAESIRLVSHIGKRAPLHCTAMGKAMLALLGLLPPRRRSSRGPSSSVHPGPSPGTPCSPSWAWWETRGSRSTTRRTRKGCAASAWRS